MRRAGIRYDDEATWGGADGMVVTGRGRHADHPIPRECPDSRWPSLFGAPALNAFLDTLHGGRARWQWVDGASEGVGWIHARFPVHDAPRWEPPRVGWHIDGDTSRLDTAQSVVVLPLVTPVASGGGGTAVAVGSHRRVARWLHDRGEAGVVRRADLAGFVNRVAQSAVERAARARLLAACGVHGAVATLPRPEVVEICGLAGDVLLLHPLTVHCASAAHRATVHGMNARLQTPSTRSHLGPSPVS